AGIREAIRLHADIVSISLAGPVGTDDLAAAVAEAAGGGVLVVAGAGNCSCDTMHYPAGYDGAVAVAAARPFGDGWTLRDRATRGEWVDVAAWAGSSSEATAVVAGMVGQRMA